MVTFAESSTHNDLIATRARGQSRRMFAIELIDSVLSDSCESINESHATWIRLVSCSRDPIGYLGSPNLFELNIFLKSVDPQGYMQQPISCQGVVVPVVGQIPKCSVLCACPGFQPHEPIESFMLREMTEQEWKNWGLPGPCPGTYESQCNAIADSYEVLNICPDDGDGGEPVKPFGTALVRSAALRTRKLVAA